MKKISYEELRIIQLDILKNIHSFCCSNGINYSLAYGTLLGAVRHGGYIPWDDDLDIAMLRSDYEKFLKEYDGYCKTYSICECRKDKDVTISFAKVYDNRTMIIQGGHSKQIGAFVDIFPIDDLGDTYKNSVSLASSYSRTRFILAVKSREMRIIKKWWKKPIVALLKLLFLGQSANKIACSMNNRLALISNPNSKFVGLIVDGNPKNEVVERSVWSKFKTVKFEDGEFLSVEETDSYLRHSYGDYMKLPPPEQQVPKHDFFEMSWL